MSDRNSDICLSERYVWAFWKEVDSGSRFEY